MSYSPRYALLKNNQPIPIGLPFPLQGVLASGEQIVTRHTPERMTQIMAQNPPPGMFGAREMLVISSADAPTESMVSDKSPPRDFFAAELTTPSNAVTNALWKLPPQIVGNGQLLAYAALLPGSYSGHLFLQGVRLGASGLSAFRASVAFQIRDDGTVANFATSALGTDVAGGNSYALTAPAGGLQLAITGTSGVPYQWTATLDLRQVLSG